MSTDIAETRSAPSDRPRTTAVWPLAVSIVFWAASFAVVGQLTPAQVPIAALVTVASLALAAVIITLLAVQRVATEPIAAPLAGLGAVAATLLALTPLDATGVSTHIVGFVIVAPWRYALPPLLVHFALELGWPHRRSRWIGGIKGWYATEAGMLVASAVGVAMNERPLVSAIDGTVRPMVLEPAGVIGALAVTALALLDARRIRRLRGALRWNILAVAAGAGPLVVVGLLTTALPVVTAAHMALILVPACTALAIFALPLRDSIRRDHAAHRAAVALIENPDVEGVARDIAITLSDSVGAPDVLVRITQPAVRVSIGDTSAWDPAAPLAIELDESRDGSDLVLPIGRRLAPLGDVHLGGRQVGAFGAAEQAWVTAFLQPIAAALRARQRESATAGRLQHMSDLVARSVGDIVRAAEQLPPGPSDAGLAVPPTVDAREVLAQLSDGVIGVVQHGEGLLTLASETRDRARAASDAVARSLDRLAGLAAQLNRLVQDGDEIAGNNATASGVAFRTNLIANNASIEAERAGAAGRTFGVLAEEVRRLADTAAATSDAIRARTATFAATAAGLAASLDLARAGLAHAIRDAEAAEQSAQRLGDAALSLEDVTHLLDPAVTEANAVAKRRSTRDRHLTTTLDRFLTERADLHDALVAHRDAMLQLATTLTTLDSGLPPRA